MGGHIGGSTVTTGLLELQLSGWLLEVHLRVSPLRFDYHHSHLVTLPSCKAY